MKFAVAPRMWRVVVFWALFQAGLVAAAFGLSRGRGLRLRGESPRESLMILGIGSGTMLVVFALCGWAYYRRLCALRERGVVVEGKVVQGRQPSIYWVKYSYGGAEYEPRVGMMVDFDSSVSETLKRAVSEKVPVRGACAVDL